ncbi:MAG: hypothetical protein EOM90_01090 [Alphaproteobacteria bacterium]|nr:hypothetical protein [Alphaproteobacteria bacterium]
MKTNLHKNSRIKILVFLFFFTAVAGAALIWIRNHDQSAVRKEFEQKLVSLNRLAPEKKNKGDRKKPKTDEPGMAAFHEFLMTFDPATGTVPRERLRAALGQTRNSLALKQANNILWQGYPSDMGGRTRAIMYDPNDPTHKKVWAGGITGGLWYNNDITDATSAWIPVGDFWACLSIRCLAYDPGNTQRLFAGTGEAETAIQTYRESSGLGLGIFWSQNGGLTWEPMPSTEQFAYVTDLVIRIENNVSVIYAGVASGLYGGNQHSSGPSDGLFRSADMGQTWQQVLPNITGLTIPYCVSDIALGADNRLYVGTRANLDGNGAAVILTSDNGLNWTVNSQYQTEILASPVNNIPGRVVLATAPSDANVVYALIASGTINYSDGFKYLYCYHILRSADKGVTWTKKNLPTDLTSGDNFATIAWHALDVAVDPNDPMTVYIGGLDIHRTINGGLTWSRLSDWSHMYGGGGPQYIHADQHVILYKPGSSEEILFGTDGGVFYTPDGSYYAPSFAQRNKNFSTLQFYTCAIHPYPGIQQYYGGLQDNGSLFYMGTGNPLTLNDMVSGGDGAYCFFDESNPSISITSVYYNQYYIFDDANFLNYAGNWSSGTFVSPADLDYKMGMLYCNAVDYLGNWQDQILRIEDLSGTYPTGTFINLNTGSTVYFSAIRYSPFSPAGKSTLFVGTQSGRLFKVQEAQTNMPQVTEIGSTAFPAANLSCIAVGKSEDTLLVTFSNYGVASVWQTYNGGDSWQNIEGNLPDMPVRWAIFHPQNNRQVMLATETGVWQGTGLNMSPAVWYPVSDGMAYVRVDMLQVRKADNTVLAATHGRGLFTTVWDISTGLDNPGNYEATVCPNPVSENCYIVMDATRPGVLDLTLTALNGTKIRNSRHAVTAGENRFTFDFQNVSPGMYLLNMTMDGNFRQVRKIIHL